MMTRTLGWIAIVWALLAFAVSIASPWATRQKFASQYGHLVSPEELQALTEAQIKATRPAQAVSAIHQTACLITGIGLLKRRSWARPAWLTLCWIGVGIVTFTSIWYRRFDAVTFTAFLLRVALLAWSIRVLGSRRARHEFASSRSR